MVPGGVFPMPPTAAELNQKLPPPYCFKGNNKIDIFNYSDLVGQKQKENYSGLKIRVVCGGFS